jgi:CP family cyanate transporter-like MFS transporter
MVTAFFGLQAMFAYAVMGWLPQVLMSAGISRDTAGLMMAVTSLLGVPISLIVAPIAARQRSQSVWVAGTTALGGAGTLGLLLAPGTATWLWVVCIGIGMGVFALAVTLISLRTRTAADTRGLSTMVQSVGYLLAAVGPLVFGMLHGLTGSWNMSLIVLLAGVAVQTVVGLVAGRDRYV